MNILASRGVIHACARLVATASLTLPTDCLLAQVSVPTIQAPSTQASQVIENVFITWYGFNDNSCLVETEYSCDMIAYPKSDGYPVRHDGATEGSGSYDDPITFAAAGNDSGGNAELKPGTLIYLPMLRKYFIMEDQCYECGLDWQGGLYHVDLWMGPPSEQNAALLYACENKLTQGDNAASGTGVIIVNPAPNLPVDTTPIYRDDKCTEQIYLNEQTVTP